MTDRKKQLTPKYRHKDWLYEQYWGEQQLTTEEMAEKGGCAESTIRHWMNQHGIPRRSANYRPDNGISPVIGFYDV